MEILHLSEGRRAEFGPRIAALEHGITYPLGDDRFEIRHGVDYFAFFRRLGELAYFVAREGESIVGVLAAVLRRLPSSTGWTRAWYLCDWKVFRGAPRGTGQALLEAFERFLERAGGPRAAYAISMNSASGDNRLARAMRRWRSPAPGIAGRLELYSLSAETMRQVSPLLATRGASRYLSLAGIKDIVLASTGKPLPLLHVQHDDEQATGEAAPVDGATHMFCLLDSDVRIAELRRSRISPSATATVFVRFPMDVDLRCVRTSDI